MTQRTLPDHSRADRSKDDLTPAYPTGTYNNYCRHRARLVNNKSCEYHYGMSKTMADLLRAKIRASGLSAAKLGKETGVTQQAISVFLRGKDIRLDTAQKLADYFGLTLKEKK